MASDTTPPVPDAANSITPALLEQYKEMLVEQITGIDAGIKRASKQCALWTGEVVLPGSTRKLWKNIESLHRRRQAVKAKIKLIDEYTSDWVEGAASSFRAELIANEILVIESTDGVTAND